MEVKSGNLGVCIVPTSGTYFCTTKGGMTHSNHEQYNHRSESEIDLED